MDPLDEDALAVAWRAAQALKLPALASELWQSYCLHLKTELGLEPAQVLRNMVEGDDGTATHLPITEMVGRRGELQELTELLEGNRLVTVLGPGGVGKTRLARHAAEALKAQLGQHVQGVVFVALDDLSTPAALPTRIASAMGLVLGARDEPLAALMRALTRPSAPRSLLLVLDGFEAVIDAAAMVTSLLAATPGLRVLVTSRERLDIDGEWLLPLGGLAVPARGASPDAILNSDAVKLFGARAQAVSRSFDLAAEHQAVADICRRLEGMPLALELAAAWVRVMPLADIAHELAAGLQLLSGTAQAGGGLRAVFDRSWALLVHSERQAFARLALFRGGFTREAAQQVADIALPLLAALCDKSMLRSVLQGRFGMHTMLAEFAREKLAALPEAAALAERHSRWYLSLRHERLQQRLADPENFLAAWRHAVARADHAAVDEALSELSWAQIVEGRMAEGAALFDTAAQALGENTPVGAHLRAHQAWKMLWLERYADAARMATAALVVLQACGHAAGTVMALRTLGHLARRAGQCTQAADLFVQALACAEKAGLIAFVAAMHDALAMALNMLGRYDAARAHIYAALPLNEALGDDLQRMYNQFNLSQSHSLAGQPAAALPWSRAALESAQRIAYAFFVPYARTELALVLLALGDGSAADEEATCALDAAHASGDRAARAWAHEALARCALARCDVAIARREVASAAALFSGSGNLAMGAALVPLATCCFAPEARATAWLQTLASLPSGKSLATEPTVLTQILAEIAARTSS